MRPLLIWLGEYHTRRAALIYILLHTILVFSPWGNIWGDTDLDPLHPVLDLFSRILPAISLFSFYLWFGYPFFCALYKIVISEETEINDLFWTQLFIGPFLGSVVYFMTMIPGLSLSQYLDPSKFGGNMGMILIVAAPVFFAPASAALIGILSLALYLIRWVKRKWAKITPSPLSGGGL